MELSIIKQLQTLRTPFLDGVMRLLNLVDTVPFYIFVILSLWFLYNQKQGVRLLFLYLLSSFTNQSLKMLCAQPRPGVLSSAVQMIKSHSFGFPSGGAQSTFVIFIFLSLTFKRRWFWCLSVFFILLIGFSRVYLGLHFFSDVLGGWIFGAVVLTLYLILLPFIEKGIVKYSKLLLQIALTMITTLLWCLTLNLHTKASVIAAFGAGTGLIWKSLLPEISSFPLKLLRLGIAIIGMILFSFLLVYTLGFHSLTSLACDLVSSLWLGCGVSYICNKVEIYFKRKTF
jgi:undecaprenyl-diphosphatase